VAKKRQSVKRPAKGRVAEPPKTAASELASPSRSDWRAALRDFSARVRQAYGSRLSRLVLYGSRARGDAVWDSDVDVLVVLKAYDDFSAEVSTLSVLSGEILRDHGIVLSAMPASVKELEESEKTIFQSVRREGVTIQ